MKNVTQPENLVKHVTNRQGVQFAEKARKSGVSREKFAEFLKDNMRVEKFFCELRNGDSWPQKIQELKLTAEKIGARIFVTELSVNYTKSHNDAAMVGGPQTGSGYNVLKVGDLYQPENKVINETIVLLNWPEGGGSYQKAVEWGLSNGLRKTTPHVPFTIGEKYPKFNYEIGSNPSYVVETTGCSFSGDADACYVYWDDAGRESSLGWQSYFVDGGGWFAFLK